MSASAESVWRTGRRWLAGPARVAAHPAVRRTTLGLAVVLLAGLAAAPWGQLLVRVDESWPHHRLFWLTRDDGPYERGELIAYELTQGLVDRIRPSEARERDYVRTGMLYLKRVLGVPGDQVAVEPLADGRARILINGQPVGETVGRDRMGRPIETGPLPSPIPPGMYYVALPHPRSFDSRYYGYVPETMIEGRVRPLW